MKAALPAERGRPAAVDAPCTPIRIAAAAAIAATTSEGTACSGRSIALHRVKVALPAHTRVHTTMPLRTAAPAPARRTTATGRSFVIAFMTGTTPLQPSWLGAV